MPYAASASNKIKNSTRLTTKVFRPTTGKPHIQKLSVFSSPTIFRQICRIKRVDNEKQKRKTDLWLLHCWPQSEADRVGHAVGRYRCWKPNTDTHSSMEASEEEPLWLHNLPPASPSPLSLTKIQTQAENALLCSTWIWDQIAQFHQQILILRS